MKSFIALFEISNCSLSPCSQASESIPKDEVIVRLIQVRKDIEADYQRKCKELDDNQTQFEALIQNPAFGEPLKVAARIELDLNNVAKSVLGAKYEPEIEKAKTDITAIETAHIEKNVLLFDKAINNMSDAVAECVFSFADDSSHAIARSSRSSTVASSSITMHGGAPIPMDGMIDGMPFAVAMPMSASVTGGSSSSTGSVGNPDGIDELKKAKKTYMDLLEEHTMSSVNSSFKDVGVVTHKTLMGVAGSTKVKVYTPDIVMLPSHTSFHVDFHTSFHVEYIV